MKKKLITAGAVFGVLCIVTAVSVMKGWIFR